MRTFRYVSFAGALAFAAGSAGAACVKKKASSDVRHAENAPVRDKSWVQWHGISDEALMWLLKNRFGENAAPDPLPSTHELAKRSQAWLDFFHAKIKEMNPGQLDAVPRPVIHILPAQELNAFMLPAARCFKAKVAFAGAEGKQAEHARGVSFAAGAFAAEDDRLCDVTQVVEDPAKVAEAVEFHNRTFPECSITYAGGAIQVPASCKNQDSDDSGRAMVGSADFFLVRSASNRIVLNTGFYGVLESEEELLGILAHELGHYYHAHSIVDLNYAYRHDDRNPTDRVPKAAPELDGLAQKVKSRSAVPVYHSIEGQKYHTAVFSVLGGLAQDDLWSALGEAVKNDPACKAYHQFAKANLEPYYDEKDQDYYGAGKFKHFPKGKIGPELVPLYRELEERFTKCASKVTTGPASAAFFEALEWPLSSWIDPAFHEGWMVEPLMSIDLPSDAKDLVGVLDEYGRRIGKVYADWAAINEELVSKRLGVYTNEQEADDLATEWLAKTGLPVGAWMRTWVNFAKATRHANDPIDEFSVDRCADLLSKGFQEGGKEVFVPPGVWSDTHHSSCYRIFNIHREIVSHGYKETPAPKADIPPMPWPELQKLAAKAMQDWFDRADVVGGGEGAMAVARGTGPRKTDPKKGLLAGRRLDAMPCKISRARVAAFRK